MDDHEGEEVMWRVKEEWSWVADLNQRVAASLERKTLYVKPF
jgi:hypothetical protein